MHFGAFALFELKIKKNNSSIPPVHLLSDAVLSQLSTHLIIESKNVHFAIIDLVSNSKYTIVSI